MPRALRELVEFRGDRLFNGAVNVDWFGTDETRARLASEAFVFHGPRYHGVSQADVGTTHGHRLQDTASFVRSIVQRCYGLEDEPFTLAIAGYGTGKSHLGLTAASLLSDPQGDTPQHVLTAIEAADSAIARDIRVVLQESGQPCLVVALNGMQSFDLTTQVTQQILHQVKSRCLDTSPLDDLRPRFAQAVSLVSMANQEVASEVLAACDTDMIDDVLAGLERQDEAVYRNVHDVFSARGMSITALRGESVRDIIDTSVREYCGEGKPFRTLLVLFDEFGKYIEFATVKPQIAGSGVLQELFEAIQANSGAACFAGFIQFELPAYVQRIAPEYRNEILRYVTRYQAANRVYLSINLETLIANLMEKQNPAELDEWLDKPESRQESEAISRDLARWFPHSKNHRLWGDAEQFHTVVRKGCWPLSPFSTWFLFHLAAAGKHLQERSALALLGQLFRRFGDSAVADDGTWSLAPVDFWSDDLQHELITSEEGGQQGAITHAYASVEARHGAGLADEAKRVLQAVVLGSKMGLKVANRSDALDALSVLAALSPFETDKHLRLLQDEYNVIEWDDASKQFDIFGDAVPRTQFLAFVRQRVDSAYDEAGKSVLFASKASKWCDLLEDLECDFAEENNITTREWRYQAVTSNITNLPANLKLATDRWCKAISVDEPRGTVIYCYAEPSRDLNAVEGDVTRLMRAAAKETGAAALPVLIVLLYDVEGKLGQALAELAVLEESLNSEDRARFGNLVPAHTEKLRDLVRSQLDAMIKQRRYVTSLRDPLEARRLGRAGTELFSRIYKSPLTFPFDGFSTAKGNAADSCQDLTRQLLMGKLDYDAVMGKPVKVKNRAVRVLSESWGIFSKNGGVRKRPNHSTIRSLTAKWDDVLSGEERRLPVGQLMQDLCMPPYGANIASAGLLLGAFVAPRVDNLVVVRDGQQYAIAQWIQDDLFRGKFIDVKSIRDVDLVLLGEESSEWEALLDEWEDAETYSARMACQDRATALKIRVPVPPALVYRESYLQDKAKAARLAVVEMDRKLNDALTKMESGERRGDVGTLSWGASLLGEQCERMCDESPLWDEQQIALMRPHLDRARQVIIQRFPEWLKHQTPLGNTTDSVAQFKQKMIYQTGRNLKKLALDAQVEALEKRVSEIVRNVETVAEASQLVLEVRSWLTAHGDATNVFRVAESRGLLDVGKDFANKLQGMSRRIDMPELGEVRERLSEFLKLVKRGVEQTEKRAGRLWNTRLHSQEELEAFLEEVDALVACFEGCDNDLRDLHVMRRALRVYHEDYKRLADDRLTWDEFERLADDFRKNAADVIDEKEVPWPPGEVIDAFVENISKQRKQGSVEWIDSIEQASSDVDSMSAADANRLHERANASPAVLIEPHAKRLAKVVKNIEKRLDALKLDWLVEKFKELNATLRQQFLKMVDDL